MTNSVTSNRRCLIVNADDFGLSPGVNGGVIQTHEQGIVTSASLMVRWPAAAEAAAYAREHSRLSLGLHVDLGEWTFSEEEWRCTYQVVPFEDAQAVADEVARQLRTFRDLVGHNPTHLDSHQHFHHTEPLHSVMARAAKELGINLRDNSPQIRYAGDFYGQSNKGFPYPEGIAVEALLRILKDLPPGVTELGCHPGLAADMGGMYRRERLLECQTLCDPSIRSAIHTAEVVLCSFSDWHNYYPEPLTR